MCETAQGGDHRRIKNEAGAREFVLVVADEGRGRHDDAEIRRAGAKGGGEFLKNERGFSGAGRATH